MPFWAYQLPPGSASPSSSTFNLAEFGIVSCTLFQQSWHICILAANAPPMTFMQIRDCSQDSRGYICKRYFLLLDLVVVKGRGAVSDCREHLARPGRRHHNPWMVSNTIPLLLLQLKFTDTLFIFPSPPKLLSDLFENFNIWTLWHICCRNKWLQFQR